VEPTPQLQAQIALPTRRLDGVRRRRASLRLVASLALSALREHPLSLLLLVLAVAAGVGFQIPNVANVAGYRAELLKQEVESGMGQVRVRPRKGTRFRDAEPIQARLSAIDGVVAAQMVLVLPAALRNGAHFSLAGVTGVDTRTPRRPYELVAGTDFDPADAKTVVLGTRMANNLNVGIGDEIELDVLLATRPRLVLDDNGVGNYSLRVVGLAGFNSVDGVYVQRQFLAGELGEDGAASGFIVHTREPSSLELARRVATQAEAALPTLTAASWFDDSRFLRSVVGALDAIANVTGVMTLVAVGVPVLALLYIDALNRRRQVSLLVAMGFRSLEIFAVFLLKAVLIGVIGVTVGIIVSGLLVAYFSAHPIFSWERFVLHPVVTLRGVIWPALLVLAATVLAGTYPAWRAARVDPSSTLRRIE
jgi:ABC-type lipoprotein release transport system permease subunit